MPADRAAGPGDASPASSSLGSSSLGIGLAFVTAAVSGVSVYVNGEAVGHFSSPTTYTTGKNLVAGGLLGVVAIAAVLRGGSGPAVRTSEPSRWSARSVVAIVAVAVLGGGLAFALFFDGLARATSSDAAFLHKTLVVWASVLAIVFLHERVGPVHVAAVALLVAGQVILADGVGSLRLGRGEVLILVATLIWSAEVVVVRWLLTHANVSAPSLAFVRVAGGALALVGWLVISGDLSGLTGLDRTRSGWLLLTGSLLAVFVSCWYAALARATVVDVTAILVVGAVVTGVLDVVVGHSPAAVRPPGWVLMTIGAAVIAVGAAVHERRRPVLAPVRDV